MKSGRKNLKKVSGKDVISLQVGHSIMQVVSLRGSNLIERSQIPLWLHELKSYDEEHRLTYLPTSPVMDSKGIKSLALFPAKFQKSFWIKRGNFVIVDESGRDKALQSGSKIACMVSQVLFHDQVRTLEKSPEWPAIFRAKATDDSKAQPLPTAENEGYLTSDEDDLPPLEANLNRTSPVELYSDADSG